MVLIFLGSQSQSQAEVCDGKNEMSTESCGTRCVLCKRLLFDLFSVLELAVHPFFKYSIMCACHFSQVCNLCSRETFCYLLALCVFTFLNNYPKH